MDDRPKRRAGVDRLPSLQRLGLALIAFAVVMAIISPDARPDFSGLVIPLIVVVVVLAVVVGLVVRKLVPLDRRLAALHALSPRVARRLLPPPRAGEKPSGREPPTTTSW